MYTPGCADISLVSKKARVAESKAVRDIKPAPSKGSRNGVQATSAGLARAVSVSSQEDHLEDAPRWRRYGETEDEDQWQLEV